MTKNYFTNEQFKEVANKADLPFEHLPDYYLQKLKMFMNLAVEAAIGLPVGEIKRPFSSSYSVKFHDEFIGEGKLLQDGTALYSVKELEN